MLKLIETFYQLQDRNLEIKSKCEFNLIYFIGCVSLGFFPNIFVPAYPLFITFAFEESIQVLEGKQFLRSHKKRAKIALHRSHM